MNSYPPELLAQLAPVMFVGGLEPPQPPGQGKDPFAVLSWRLRESLLHQRKVAIWQPERARKFQVVIADKDVRFPPRKLVPPDDPQYQNSHSPLSPLTPTSPLYPDGLIAPIWIRKHTTLIPSVLVVFMRIYEYPQAERAPLETEEIDQQRETEERRKDNELCAEIAQRKRVAAERGIKLTVVLLASRKMLDEAVLDVRLTYIRRNSGLDPRAALFVLSPVSQSEVGEFVHSLQEALWEPALEYYTNHSKRVRRKRNRHSQAVSAYSHPPLRGEVRPLRTEGWSVRYEYKLACFAEFRGEDEVALRHYQDAYASLLIMFGSTAILPPRTKRWAEAKVLADCINMKICKLYLYNNEHSLALSTHNNHMRKFADFSRGWGIGEETFEFWSWLARQHRAFAELLEQGTRSTLTIPTHFSTSPPAVAAAAAVAQTLDSSQRNILEMEAMRMLGLNPTQALQHPGFYYYMAAKCTERRRERFLSALDAESKEEPTTTSPGFTNEKKVDHLALVLETGSQLYTRSYELFKAFSPSNTQGHSRLTLWIAYCIAQTYYESGKFDMAVRFFERIAKTYRREKWGSLLQPLLTAWYSCAQQMGDMELSVRLLFEMLGHGIRTQQDDADSTQEDLSAVLKSSVPSTTEEPFVIDSSDSEPILISSTVFWRNDVIVGEAVAFQLSLTARPTVSMASLPFASLSIHFSSDLPPVTIRHTPAVYEGTPSLQKIDLGYIASPTSEAESEGKEVEGSLRWRPDGKIVFSGSVSSDVPTVIKITKLVLTLKEGSWQIQVPLFPSATHAGATYPKWLNKVEPLTFVPIRREHYSTVTVRHRPHKVEVNISHHAPALIGEEFPICINVKNFDDRDMDIVVDALLQPTEIDEAENFIRIGDDRSTSLVKGASLGVIAPGASTSITLHLASAGAAYDRVIDISVQSRVVAVDEVVSGLTPPGSPTAPSLADRDEALRTLVIPAVEPIRVEQQVLYNRSLRKQPGLADLATYSHEFWDDGDVGEAIATTSISCTAPSGIVVEAVKVVRENNNQAHVIDSSIEQSEEDFLSEWLSGDEFCDRCRIGLAIGEDYIQGEDIAGPGMYELSWRRILPDGTYGPTATSRFPLPPLRPPVDALVALLHAPPSGKLHVPFLLRLDIRNRHPSRAANIVVHLETDTTDSFVVAGLRSGRIPILLPGAEESLVWKLIPVECGFVKVPHIRVLDRRRDPQDLATIAGDSRGGEIVRIVDVRWDGRSGVEGGVQSDAVSRRRSVEEQTAQPLILVL
ncbi:hypothetical protein IEO21_07571 [Rhodonia placenta]|uniref:Trafficking protein particle complex subunit 11 n=1 Tax=Rhodonia placenta TaxID=104341 RepID=A0A8H7NXX8_9APHY|nr:hypothetical protein IEO21_07571 [Postia placenta]